ncbi:MAG: MFS transporter, partial [Chloroflexi bacterium]|nr:MFS transporter [Chloroflexota bacterium]
MHAHPTQALLDLMTMRRHLGSLEGAKVVIVGDVLHSRVARSNAFGLAASGASVVLCGPPTMMPLDLLHAGRTPSLPNVTIEPDLDAAIEDADVVMTLRLQTERQGTALGIFGVGNVGAAVTNFGAPFLLVALGWQSTAQVYSVILAITAVLFYLLTKDDPAVVARRRAGEKPSPTLMELEPLKRLQVWRFSLYYFFVFGAFVALALWLPRYYQGVYGLDIKTAGMLAAAYALPGSIFRALGGWLSDRFGARRVMYWTFAASVAATFMMSYPATEYIVQGIKGPIGFTIATPLPIFVGLTIFLGFFMSLGKAAVYKHIPVYYPDNVGSVGGLVGMIGGLGGFVLPIAFGVMNDLIGVWTSCFMLLFAFV